MDNLRSQPPTVETFARLNELYASPRHNLEQAQSLAQSISPDALAAWLQKRIANPAAERHLLQLFFGQDGATSGNVRAYRSFYRELILRLRPQLQRSVIEGGEISLVAELLGSPIVIWRHPETGEPMPVIYKKMPTFRYRSDAENYVQYYREYNTILHNEIGISVPHFDARIVETEPGQILIFVIQERVASESVCHTILQDISPQAAERLYALILHEYKKLHRFNQDRAADGYQLGLDGQIPNWAIADYGGDPHALTGKEQLLYLDTNVPMIRIHGQDVVSTDMYFQALPGIARKFIKQFNLDQEVMDRYFQLRIIILDFLANVILHHRANLVPRFLEMSNKALNDSFAEEDLAPITLKEIQSYHRLDVALWRLWRSLKLLGAISDGVSGGDWRALGLIRKFYGIWTKPIQ